MTPLGARRRLSKNLIRQNCHKRIEVLGVYKTIQTRAQIMIGPGMFTEKCSLSFIKKKCAGEVTNSPAPRYLFSMLSRSAGA